MDISKAVTVPHEMKRGNYAVSNSDLASLGYVSEPSNVARYDIRETLIGNYRQEGQGQTGADTIHDRQERAPLCVEDSVQGEQIQRDFIEQIEWSTWSMAVTMGKTKVVITQTDKRSTRLRAASV